MQRLMGSAKLRIRSAMNDYRSLADRRRHAGDITFAHEGPDNLHAEIDRHDRRAFVMIEKDIVAIGPQTGVLAEEIPHTVERRFKAGSLHAG